MNQQSHNFNSKLQKKINSLIIKINNRMINKFIVKLKII